jgi:hypothetical protein
MGDLTTPLGTRGQNKSLSPPSTLYFPSSYHYFPSFHTTPLLNTPEGLTPVTSNVNLQKSSYLIKITATWHETTICYIIILFIRSSMALQTFAGPWLLLQFHNLFYTDGRTPWMGYQHVARPLPPHRTTQTQTSMP